MERDDALLSAGLTGGRAARGSSKGVEGRPDALLNGRKGDDKKGECDRKGELEAAKDDERDVDTTLLG